MNKEPRGGPRQPRERVLGRAAEGGQALTEAFPAHFPLHRPCNAGSTMPTGAWCELEGVHLPPKQTVASPGSSVQTPRTDLRKAMCLNP